VLILIRNRRPQFTITISPVRYQLREIWIGNRFVLLYLVDIDVVESKEIEKFGAVDRAQAEKLGDARLGDAVLQLGQPAV